MSVWKSRIRSNLMQIIYIVKIVHPEIQVRVSFIGYDDIGKQDSLQCVNLTSDLMKLLQYINTVQVQPRSWQNETLMLSFDDKVKDLRGAMRLAVNNISWNTEAVRMIMHVADKDCFREKADREYFANYLSSDFDRLGVHYMAVRINDNNDHFVEEMKRFIR